MKENKRIYNILCIYGLLLFDGYGGLSSGGLEKIFELENIDDNNEQLSIINGITNYITAYRAATDKGRK